VHVDYGRKGLKGLNFFTLHYIMWWIELADCKEEQSDKVV